MTAVTHARHCNTAPQAPDSELRTSYIVIRTFKLQFINRKAEQAQRKMRAAPPG